MITISVGATVVGICIVFPRLEPLVFGLPAIPEQMSPRRKADARCRMNFVSAIAD